jgi:hypothetical protein
MVVTCFFAIEHDEPNECGLNLKVVVDEGKAMKNRLSYQSGILYKTVD